MKRSRIALAFGLTLFGVPWAGAVAQDKPAIAIERPWARASIGTARPSAAYMTIVNLGAKPARLTRVESPVARRAEVHRTVKRGDIMSMAPAGPVEVPPGERVTLAPGGLHIMLMGLKRPLRKGGVFRLTLRFAGNRAIDVRVPIMGPGARGPSE